MQVRRSTIKEKREEGNSQEEIFIKRKKERKKDFAVNERKREREKEQVRPKRESNRLPMCMVRSRKIVRTFIGRRKVTFRASHFNQSYDCT